MVNIPGASNFDRIFEGAKTLAPPCSSCPRAVYQVARCAVVILLFCYKVALVVVVFVCVVISDVCVCDKIIVLLVLFFEEKDFFFVRKLLFFKRTDEGIFWLFLCSLFRCFSSCKFIIHMFLRLCDFSMIMV